MRFRLSAQSPQEKEQIDRIESFSDGVFSVALTLLAFDLKQPQIQGPASNSGLFFALLSDWPMYLALLLSYIQIFIMWVNHRAVLKSVARASGALSLVNAFLLFCTVLVPFMTSLVSTHLRDASAGMACASYAALFLCINISYNLLWHVACQERNSPEDSRLDELSKKIRRAHFFGFPGYLMAVVVAFFQPILSLLICSLLWILWFYVARLQETELKRRR